MAVLDWESLLSFYGFSNRGAILKHTETHIVIGRQAFSIQATEFWHLFSEPKSPLPKESGYKFRQFYS